MAKVCGGSVLGSAAARRWCLLFFCAKLVTFCVVLRVARRRGGGGGVTAAGGGALTLSGRVPAGVAAGNAGADGAGTRRWFVGHFLPSGSARASADVEMKWASHARGASHAGAATNVLATSIAILVAGTHRLEFPGANVTLRAPGDYVLWPPGTPHRWTALDDSTVLTVRWPSRPDDQAQADSLEPPPQADRVDAPVPVAA